MKTVNGREKKNYDRQLFRISRAFEALEKLDKRLAEHDERVKETIENRSQETIERQNKFHKEKAEMQKRINELNEELPKCKDYLYSALLEASKEKGVKFALDLHKDELKIFREASNEFCKIAPNFLSRFINYNDELFAELSKENKDFVFVAPKGSLLKLDTKVFDSLDVVELENLLKLYEKYDLTKTEKFAKNYKKCFPSLIEDLTDIEDFKYAVSRFPNYYNKMNKSIREQITKFAPELKALINKTPNVIKYMPSEDIEIVAFSYNKFIGKQIFRYPEILKKLDSNFFQKYKPKYVFDGINKYEAYEQLKDYFNKFPDLNKYFESCASFNKQLSEAIKEDSGLKV